MWIVDKKECGFLKGTRQLQSSQDYLPSVCVLAEVICLWCFAPLIRIPLVIQMLRCLGRCYLAWRVKKKKSCQFLLHAWTTFSLRGVSWGYFENFFLLPPKTDFPWIPVFHFNFIKCQQHQTEWHMALAATTPKGLELKPTSKKLKRLQLWLLYSSFLRDIFNLSLYLLAG